MKRVEAPLGSEMALSCQASPGQMSSSAPPVTYSWTKHQGSIGKDTAMQGVDI